MFWRAVVRGLLNNSSFCVVLKRSILERWTQTDVDALFFMDDWGAQQALLISPELWRQVFKPMYRDYIDIAHGAGKAAFMHSDGHTLAILPDLIELGLDAINAQIFCMGLEPLARIAGRAAHDVGFLDLKSKRQGQGYRGHQVDP